MSSGSKVKALAGLPRKEQAKALKSMSMKDKKRIMRAMPKFKERQAKNGHGSNRSRGRKERSQKDNHNKYRNGHSKRQNSNRRQQPRNGNDSAQLVKKAQAETAKAQAIAARATAAAQAAKAGGQGGQNSDKSEVREARAKTAVATKAAVAAKAVAKGFFLAAQKAKGKPMAGPINKCTGGEKCCPANAHCIVADPPCCAAPLNHATNHAQDEERTFFGCDPKLHSFKDFDNAWGC